MPSDKLDPVRCACGTPFSQKHMGRPRLHCSHACRQRATREKTKLEAIRGLKLVAIGRQP